MSLSYRVVDWNRQKRWYDISLGLLLLLGLGTYLAGSALRFPNLTLESLILRGTAIAAFTLLHVILAIGPLARLDRRFLPWLYNRRHLGVTLFFLALVHAVFALLQFHALSDTFPLLSVFTAYQRDYRILADGRFTIAHFPFEPFGLAALVIFFVMAATSHDFWLRNLGAAFWKSLHLAVYVAYGLLLAHVALGALQAETSPVYPVVLGAGFITLAGLHLTAARREQRVDRTRSRRTPDGYVAAGALADFPENQGRVVMIEGRRIAAFRQGDRVFATSNVCRHQGGALGEGRLVDGCITCPWHGWTYQPHDGCSPPPFQERVATYPVRIDEGVVYIGALPNPAPDPTVTILPA